MNKEQETLPNVGNPETAGTVGNMKDCGTETDGKRSKSTREPRKTTVSFRVSKTQRERIGQLADKCGMTISDYVLARAYDYRPKARLTPRQESIRDELVMARSDYARYTSMLGGMSRNERRAMFRNQSWMIGALQLLGRTAEAITRIIDRHFAPNRVPECPKIQDRTEAEKDTETEEQS